MHEILEQVALYLRGMWRYRWYAMFLAWLVAVAGWVVVYKLPDQYQATARVYVDTDSVLRPLLRGLAVQSDVGQRLRLVTQTLLSRPNLEKLARMTDLDIRAATPEATDMLMRDLKSNLHIGTTRQQNLYNISYSSSEPQLAKRVVQSLLTIFVEGTLGESRQDADSAQKFLDRQIAEYENKLEESENRLLQFRLKYMGVLRGGDFFEQLRAAQSDLEQTRLLLREAEYRREELQRQFEDSEESTSLFTMVETPVTTSLDGRIETLQSRLDELLLRYTEQHPDIREIQRTIVALQHQKRQEIEAMTSPEGGWIDDNPMQQQLRLALGEADANLASLRVRAQEYEERIQQLQNLVGTRPEIETELKRLNRDYNVYMQNYNALVARRESARMGEDMEQTGDNVRFKVIDPPQVPSAPTGPNRFVLSSMVLGLALAGGLGLAFLLSQLRPAIFDKHALQQMIGLPVYGTVTTVWSPARLLKWRLESGAYIAGAVMLVLTYSGVTIIHIYS